MLKSLLRPRMIEAFVVKLWRGVRWRLARAAMPLYARRWEPLYWLATWYRRVFLRRVVVIGVTGSTGKTTTKETIAAMLSSRFEVRKSVGNRNFPPSVARGIFGVRPWDGFFVQEVSIGIRGQPFFGQSVRMLRPQIAVVTNIGTDHLSAFGTLENIAAEKGQLVAALPPHGTAVLNADDERVVAMRERCAGSVITYGLTPEATVAADNVRCSWPDRLSFTVHYEHQSIPVQTQLCGKHWVSCVLAAVGVGVAIGLPLETVVEAVRRAEPFPGRLSPVERPDGITFIRDDYKAPLWTVAPALDFLGEARAKRKIAVVGTLSDYRGDAAGQYVKVARHALEVADFVFFVGRWSSRCLRAKRHAKDEALRAFSDVGDLCRFLEGFLQPGDLVLLKGRENLDDLARVVDVLPTGSPPPEGAISLPRPDKAAAGSRDAEGIAAASPPGPTLAPEGAVEVVVGLGNPGERYLNTRHNVGQRVIDSVARSLGADWTQEGQAMLARVEGKGKTVYLVRPLTKVNRTGEMLLGLAQHLGFGPRDCVLVHDDLDLPAGAMRQRMRGGAGGHNGVRAIIDAFQSEDFRRIRIGIGRPEGKNEITSYVLGEFTEMERPLMERACSEAAGIVTEKIASGRRL